MFKKYLDGFREIRQIDSEFTALFKLGGMDYNALSNRARSYLRMNAHCYGSKQTFIAALPSFAEHGLLKIDIAEVEALIHQQCPTQ